MKLQENTYLILTEFEVCAVSYGVNIVFVAQTS